MNISYFFAFAGLCLLTPTLNAAPERNDLFAKTYTKLAFDDIKNIVANKAGHLAMSNFRHLLYSAALSKDKDLVVDIIAAIESLINEGKDPFRITYQYYQTMQERRATPKILALVEKHIRKTNPAEFAEFSGRSRAQSPMPVRPTSRM